MNLIIVESPTKARTLSRFLGDGYRVEATMGHIKDLPKSTLGVDIKKNFKPEYLSVEKRAKTVKDLQKEAKKAKIILIATDPDREGEAIAQHVYEVLLENGEAKTKSKKTASKISKDQFKRIVFHEITKEAVEEAIANPRKIDGNLVEAQVARRVLDRLVGYKLSPLLWKKVRRGLSAGRVQSVTVRLIVEKEREIEAFKSVEFWEIFSEIKGKRQEVKEPFIVKLAKINGKNAEVKNKEQAEGVVSDLQKTDYKVNDVQKKEVRKNPYPPFTTSTMSQVAARLFGWSAKRTMSVAQKLYEEGLITYHRTDSTNIAPAAITKVRDYITKSYGKDYLPEKPRFYKTSSKVAQEAHEAIRPTDINTSFKMQDGKFGREGEKLYELIWKRFVACQMNPSVYDETKVEVLASHLESEEKKDVYTLRTSGQVMKFDGWRRVMPLKVTEGEDVQKLPDVVKDDSLDLIKVISEQKFTQPPARFNEASLIKTLEKLGIGRPSTYAPIISTIQLRQYVQKDEGKFSPTNVGIAVNDFLMANFPDVFDYSFTAEMESDLDKVANGEAKWQEELKTFWGPFAGKLATVEKDAKRVKIEAEKLGKKCPDCEKGEQVIRIGRFGKFISCSLFPDCKFTAKYEDRINMKCPDCKEGNVIVKTTRKGRKFFGCSRYPECEYASWKNPQLKKQGEDPQETESAVSG